MGRYWDRADENRGIYIVSFALRFGYNDLAGIQMTGLVHYNSRRVTVTDRDQGSTF